MPSRRDASNYSRDSYRARPDRISGKTSRPPEKARRAQRQASPNPSRYDRAGYTRPSGQRVSQPQTSRRYSSNYANASTSYSLSSGNIAAFQKRSRVPFFIVVALCTIAVLAALFFFIPRNFDVTVNGTTVNVSSRSTLQTLIDDGYATPTPGNLMAVDGSIAKRGEGDALSATINGENTNDPKAQLVADAVITIEDGADVIEEYTEKTEPLAYGVSSQSATPESYYTGAIHLYSQGVDGVQSVRTGSVSGKTATVVLEHPTNKGFTSYSADVGDDKVIALTFDDGPWPETTREILEILKDNDAHATFFVIGEQCKNNASVLKQLSDAGNQIATHSYDHADGSGQGVNLTFMTTSEQIAEITKGFDAIEDAIGKKVSQVMRAPGGNYYGDLVQTLAPYVQAEVGWDVDTLDWQRPGVDAIVERLLSVEPGDIVLMHDGGGNREQSVEALRVALPQLKQMGYSFITIDELLEYGVSGSS